MTKPVFGCPFHGLVKGGELTLPDASKMSYPQPYSGELGASGMTQRVKGAGAAVPQRTPEELAKDMAKGYQWLDYAIVSGKNGQICGQELGEHWHLYTDPSGVTWKMTAQMYVSSLQVKIRIRLINAYGRFPKRWEDVDREILSADFSLPNGESDQTEYLTAPAYLRAPESNSDGSVLLFHLYWGQVNTFWNDWNEFGFPYDQDLRAIYKVTLSGSGNYEESQLPLGQGINAAVVLYKDLNDTFIDLGHNDSTYVTVPTWDCNCSDTESYYVADEHYIIKRIARIVFDSDDTEIEISSRKESSTVSTSFTRTRTNCGGGTCDLEENWTLANTSNLFLLRDDVVVAQSGDYIEDISFHRTDALSEMHTIITWRGLTLRDTTELNPGPDGLPGDHPDGVNVNTSIAFISPQVIGVLAKQATRNGPGNFTLKRVHVGPAIAAEDDDSSINQFDPATESWWYKIFGSYEPQNKTISRATDEAICYV